MLRRNHLAARSHDFCAWKDHNAYQRALKRRLLRDLRVETNPA